MWQDITFRTGQNSPGPHVSLWWIAVDWQSCPSHSATSLNTDTSRSPSPVFLFLRHWSITSENSEGIKNPQVGNSHQFTSVLRSREALHSPLELSSTGCLFSRDSPVVDKSFTEISPSQVGGARLGTEQKYFCNFAAMTRWWLCISSFQDWTGAALNRSIKGLIDHVDIGSVSTEQLLEQLKATLQLSQSVATAWYDGATLDCAIAYNILLHQQDRALWGVSPLVPLEERERLRTAPFGASLLFDELATKLQRDKVASWQRDYTL